MLGLTNSTPTYQGNGQTQANGGGFLAGIFGYLFGSNTPAYQGNGQPTSSSGGLLGGLFSSSSPGYRSVPPATTQPPPPATVDAFAPSDGCPPNGTPPVYVVIP